MRRQLSQLTLICIVCVCACVALTTRASRVALGMTSAPDVVYFYDELGRLVGVVDGNGDAVRYSYDSVGNLLSISRWNSSTVAVVVFNPSKGAVGDTVTIFGTGFSTTPSQNTVSFNGTAATVSSSTANQIIVTVPAGATTGTLSVTSPAGSAVSSSVFTVTNATGAPTISGFTPAIATAGTAVTVSGSNFDPAVLSNNVVFHLIKSTVASAAPTSIGTSVPIGATSGRISVATPLGKAVSSADFFVPPSPFTASDVLYTGRMSVGGTTTATIGAANKIGLLLFDGTAGQRVSFKMFNVSISNSTFVVYNPSGTSLTGNQTVGTSGLFIDTKTLPTTGTYTILIDPQAAYTGSMTITIYDVVDVVSNISAGGSGITVTTTTPGQNAWLPFSGTSSQRVSLKINGVTMTSTNVSVFKPDGSTLFGPSFVNNNGTFVEPMSLTASGTYKVLVDPTTTNIGNMTLTLYDVPPDVSGTITPGTPLALTVTTPGQNAKPTFTGTTGQRISLNMSGVTIPDSTVSILKPDGSVLTGYAHLNTSGAYIDTQTLPVDGAYSVLVDPSTTNTGNVTLTLNSVPADVSGTITPGGSAVSVTTTVAGQNARLTFTGAANQKVSLNTTGVTLNTSYVSITKPDSSTLLAPTFVSTTGKFFDTMTLPAAGTYTILVDPAMAYTGNMTLQLYDVVDVTGSITLGGSAVTVSTTVPGQNGVLTFAGTQNQRTSLLVNSATIPTSVNNTITIYKPDGSSLTSIGDVRTGSFVDVQTLPTTGNYTILVNPSLDFTGNVTLTLYDVPADTTGTVTVGGSAVAVTLTTPGQNGTLTFSGTSGQQITVHVTGNTMGSITVSLLKPDGSTLTSSTSINSSFNLATQTLPTTGTYTVKVNPTGSNTGSTNINVTNP